jgi:hypothetical protein
MASLGLPKRSVRILRRRWFNEAPQNSELICRMLTILLLSILLPLSLAGRYCLSGKMCVEAKVVGNKAIFRIETNAGYTSTKI